MKNQIYAAPSVKGLKGRAVLAVQGLNVYGRHTRNMEQDINTIKQQTTSVRERRNIDKVKWMDLDPEWNG